MKRTYSGAKMFVTAPVSEQIIVGNGTLVLPANKWCVIVAVAPTNSTLPIGKVGYPFKTPDVSLIAEKIVPATGDIVKVLTTEVICTASCEYSMEEGTVETTDGCSDGYNQSILDGFVTLSGSLSGFAKYDETTGEISTSTEKIFGKFVDVITDDGEGNYTYQQKTNEPFMMFICHNKDAKVDEVQNWLVASAIITSFSGGAGLKDAQKADISWTKGEGAAVLYKRTVFSGDVI